MKNDSAPYAHDAISNGSRPKQIVVGISGASGAAYARRLVECLCDADARVHLVVSPNGRRLLSDELGSGSAGLNRAMPGGEVSAFALLGRDDERVVVHPYKDVGAVIASGSFHTDGMVICPCSTSTLAAVAAGFGDNLLHRTASVTLKESRRLVLVPREMPLSQIDLENCVRLSRAGAIICPASPGFYMNPASIDDLVDFVVGKLLDLVAIPHQLNTRWGVSPA